MTAIHEIEIVTAAGLHCAWMEAKRVDGYLRRYPNMRTGAQRGRRVADSE